MGSEPLAPQTVNHLPPEIFRAVVNALASVLTEELSEKYSTRDDGRGAATDSQTARPDPAGICRSAWPPPELARPTGARRTRDQGVGRPARGPAGQDGPRAPDGPDGSTGSTATIISASCARS